MSIPDTGPIVILATGQSLVYDYVSYSWAPPSNLHFWNGDYTDPGHSSSAMPNNIMRLSHSFGAAVAQAYPGREVYVVNVAKGGESIIRWKPGAGGGTDMYAATKAAVEACLAEVGATQLAFVLWNQGQSDWLNDKAASYIADWQTVWGRYVCETWCPRITPFVIMAASEVYAPPGTNPDMRQFNQVLRQIAGMEQFRVFVDTRNLPSSMWEMATSYGLHMTAPGYYAAGQVAGLAALCGYGQKEPGKTTVYKRASTIRSNTAAPTQDKELRVWCRAGLNYRAEFHVKVLAGHSSGFKWQLSGPAAVVISGHRDFIKTTVAATNPQAFTSYPIGQAITDAADFHAEITIIVTLLAVSTDGWLSFDWSQNTAQPENTYVTAASYLEAIETA